MIELNFTRTKAMDRALPSFKSHKFPMGALIAFKDLIPGSFNSDGKDIPNDKIEIIVSGTEEKDGTYLLPVREFLKMTEGNGKSLYAHEAGQENVTLPAGFKVTKEPTDREDRDGKKIYPVQAYNAFEDQIEQDGSIDWNALVDSGVKADNELSPVQNYTIELA